LEFILGEIEALIADCSIDEANAFWMASERIRTRYRVAAILSEVEALLVASVCNENTVFAAVSEQLQAQNRYSSDRKLPEIPEFLARRRVQR
jgi:hypothetical protein